MKAKYYKDRVQIKNPMTDRWVKVDTKRGKIIGHKTNKKPYKRVRKYADYIKSKSNC